MNNDTLSQLEATTNELSAAVKSLVSQCRTSSANTGNATSNINLLNTSGGEAGTANPVVPVEASSEVLRARQAVLGNLIKLQTQVSEPADFLRQLAKDNQLLACLQWLGEFQVLACIPLTGSVPIKDVADLAGVPESTLARVVRMTATAGLLCEPERGHVAHSSLSAPFVTKLSFLDAAMFLSETSAPTALHMAAATQRFGESQRPNESAYNVAFDTSATFASTWEQRPKLQRQWAAYLRYGIGEVDSDASTIEILTRLDWHNLGNSSVAMVNARSPRVAVALADLYPGLHFLVQMGENSTRQSLSNRTLTSLAGQNGNAKAFTPTLSTASSEEQIPQRLSSRISVQQRAPGTIQAVHNAAIYILDMPSPSPKEPSHTLLERIVAELRAHISVLRVSPSASLVLIARLLPEPGTVDPDVEAIARLRDLFLLQLTNERETEVFEVVNMINSVKDTMGRLNVVNKLHSSNNATIALEVRYQPYTERQ